MDVGELAVLVIEDDNSYRDKHMRMLRESGVEKIDFAASREDAIWFLKKREYDIIFSDTFDDNHPRDDRLNNPMGPKSVEYAKSLGHNPFVIACSYDKKSKELWENVGFNYFLEKGNYSFSDVFCLINSLHFE